MSLSETIKPYVKGEDQEVIGRLQQQERLDTAFHLEDRAEDVNRVASGLKPRAMAEFNGATMQNMESLELRMQLSPPQTGWALNLHPWAIRTNAGRSMRDVVPACEVREVGPDEPLFSYLEFPWHDVDMRPQVDGSWACDAILPIVLAGQFMREANTNELWGPGVMVYENQKSPEEMWEENPLIQVFTDRGWPVTGKVKAKIRQRGSRELVDGERLVPITRPFRTIYQELRQRRNQAYLRLVTSADESYHAADGKEKRWHVNGTLRMMARMLVAERVLPKLPAWNLETTIDAGLEAESCKGCGGQRVKGAILCTKCGKPFDLLSALKEGFIDFDYVGLRMLPPEQLAEVMRFKKEVEDNQRKAGLILAREAKEAKAAESGATSS